MTDSTTRIEEDLRATRARMDGRLTELQEHLTPGQILDDVMAYFRDSGGGDFGRNLMTSVRSNPLPAAITGIGLAWLMVSGSGTTADMGDGVRSGPSPRDNRATPGFTGWGGEDLDLRLSDAEMGVVRSENETEETWRTRLDAARGSVVGVAREAGETAESFGQRISDAIGKAKQSVMGKVHDIQDRASDAGGQMSAMAQQASDKVAQGSQRAKEAGSKLIGTIGDNPLLLGAVALGVGALLGALIPQSEQEEAALGDAAAKIRQTARNAAQGVVDRGSEIADQVLTVGLESASAHGLSGDTSVGELLDSARSGEFLDKVEGAARDTLQSTQAALRDGPNWADSQEGKSS
jgi:ElaB/YqjD/DUF883 family membrane-anchored ribosome-binding protein